MADASAPAAPPLPAAPQEPRAMRDVYQQILVHPEYALRLSKTTRWVFEAACVRGHSWCTRENNAWSRQIWRFLYAGGPAV